MHIFFQLVRSFLRSLVDQEKKNIRAAILQLLHRFPEITSQADYHLRLIVNRTAQRRSPAILCTILCAVAGKGHSCRQRIHLNPLIDGLVAVPIHDNPVRYKRNLPSCFPVVSIIIPAQLSHGIHRGHLRLPALYVRARFLRLRLRTSRKDSGSDKTCNTM